MHLIPEYFALINQSNSKILSVVTKNYHLITNEDAIELGKKTFSELFNIDAPLKVFKVITSRRKTFCHIDFIHESVNLNVWEQDTWYPFLRVTNSYNKTFALGFELGFVRKLCSNGVIFSKNTVKVKYSHSNDIRNIKVEVNAAKLVKVKNEFMQHMFNLKRFYISKSHFFSLACKALNVRKPQPLTENGNLRRKLKMFESLKEITEGLSISYIGTEGENAYAFFNVITDLVSHQDEYKNLALYDLHPGNCYTKPALWVEDFVKNAEKRDFSIETYIGDYKSN